MKLFRRNRPLQPGGQPQPIKAYLKGQQRRIADRINPRLARLPPGRQLLLLAVLLSLAAGYFLYLLLRLLV